MPKHSRPPSSEEADSLTEKILNNPTYCSRLLALMNGVRIDNKFRVRKKISTKKSNELDYLKLRDYIDETAPLIESMYFG